MCFIFVSFIFLSVSSSLTELELFCCCLNLLCPSHKLGWVGLGGTMTHYCIAACSEVVGWGGVQLWLVLVGGRLALGFSTVWGRQGGGGLYGLRLGGRGGFGTLV